MKYLPQSLTFLMKRAAILILALGQTNRVCAAANIIIDLDTSEMSRVFVEYQPGQRDEVADTLGIGSGSSAGLINVASDAVVAEVYYEFKKLHTFAVSVPTASLEDLRNDPNILRVEEDHRIFPIGIEESTTSGRSLRGLQSSSQTVPYGIDMVKARDVWDANRDGIVDSGAPTGANRKICIIDSGFQATHEDLQGINVSGYDGFLLPWNRDGDGHGTHVAGTIAAMNNNVGVVGVTPGTVQLYIVRVFNNYGFWAYTSDLISAANRCASAGANIINMSLGFPVGSKYVHAKFDELNAQGILSIAAASNDGDTSFSYPASYPSVISVASIDSSKVVAKSSNRNCQVDIAAPGVDILSTVIPGGYAYKSGTSMATPHVSAVAALIWSAKPSATNEQVRAALINTAEDLGVVGRDDLYGHGLVNAKRAFDYLSSPSMTPKPTTRKPTPRPTRDCCWLCWKCKRDQKKIANQDKAAAAAHECTPDTISCMSGDTRVGIQSINETLNNLTLFKTVRDLSIGDTIRGLDKDLNPADCLVQAIGPYGNGTVYGNYTDDHYILNPVANVVLPNGNSSVSSEVDKYSVLTSCPVGLDESGVGFTPFDSDFFGANTVSWSDYVLIHRAIVDIVKVVGSFVFSPQTYTSMEEVSEYTHAFYTTLLTCTKDPKSCDAFEMASLELVEMSMTEESRMKVGAAFPDFGQLNMPGSIASSVTNGASVIYSWVPDWTGLNKGCVSAPLGSIETYTPKYDEQSACCSFHYNWDIATCMGMTTVLPPSGWYPVSSIQFQHHVLHLRLL
jgi:hypothetical protein